MLYLDTSASVKLVLAEEGTDELRGFLEAEESPLTTSRVGIVELRHVGRRRGTSPDRADVVSALLIVIELDRMIERVAVELDPRLRALDAIHLASALSLGEHLEAFVCYDDRLAAAARREGLRVVAPGA